MLPVEPMTAGVGSGFDQGAFMPLGTQAGIIPPSPPRGGSLPKPCVRCFGSGTFDRGAFAPLGTATGVLTPTTTKDVRRPWYPSQHRAGPAKGDAPWNCVPTHVGGADGERQR